MLMRSFTSRSSSLESGEINVIGLYEEGGCGGMLGFRIERIVAFFQLPGDDEVR